MKLEALLLVAPLLGVPVQGGSVASPPAPHDLHVSYGNLGVEGSIAILQIRIFKDDLEEALRRLGSLEDSFRMEVSPGVDSLFLRYVAERFVVQANGQRIMGRIVGSGEDELDREPVWNVQLRFDAPEAIRSMRITYTVLFEVFDDQRNVLRVVKFPEERRLAYYFAEGEETIEVSF